MKHMVSNIKHIEIMAHNSFIPKHHFNPALLIGLEKHLLQKHYSFLKVRSNGRKLTCVGQSKPSEFSITYTYKVKYAIGEKPKVYSVYPAIAYHEDIHMYLHDNSLCLFYPKDFSWTSTSHLYDTIIPWTHEWFLFYELYLIYGVWMYPSISHKNQKQL